MMFFAGRPTAGLLIFGSTKAEEVVNVTMTPYEILMIVFTVIGLLLTVFALGNNKR